MMDFDERSGQPLIEPAAPPPIELEQSTLRGQRLDAWGWFALVLGSVLLSGEIVGDLYFLVESLDGKVAQGSWTWPILAVLAETALIVVGARAVLRGQRHLQRVLPNLVLLSPGPGDSLRWEVEQAVRRDDPERLVLVATRDRQQYADFRAAVGNLFPKGLPDDPPGRRSRIRHVRAVVWFEWDWTPHLELLAGRLPLFRSAARTQYALPRALQPVYERARLQVPVRGASSLPRPRKVLASVALLSASWYATLAAFVVFVIGMMIAPNEMKGGGVGGTGIPSAVLYLFIGFSLWWSVSFAVWMRQVLRGGPFATVMGRIFCIPLGFVFLVGAFALLFSGLLFVRAGLAEIGWTLLPVSLNLLVAAVAVSLIAANFMSSREVREWVDSRT